MTNKLDTLATALYVRTDDLLKESPQLAPLRPAVGIAPQLSDAELVTLAVMQALLGFTSEARWIRHARAHLRHLFPYLPQQPGCNKRLRAARGLIRHCARALTAGTSLWSDDVWVVDSTPVECARSRETVKRSDLAGWARVRVLRLPLPVVLGPPAPPAVHPARPARRVRPDRGQGRRAAGPAGHPRRRRAGSAAPRSSSSATRTTTAATSRPSSPPTGSPCSCPARKGEPEPAGRQYFKPLRQVIESVNDTLKGQLDLERHGGRTVDGVTVRILQRILALIAAIWHNDATGQPVMRSLMAYDH